MISVTFPKCSLSIDLDFVCPLILPALVVEDLIVIGKMRIIAPRIGRAAMCYDILN
jgi:hypothetical protein